MRLFGTRILLTSVTFALGNNVYEPYRISFSDLLSEDFSEPLLNALTEVGIVSIKNIPGYSLNKDKALSYLHPCNVESEAREVSLKDGTVRRTLATKSVSGPGGAQKIFMNEKQEELSSSCMEFVLSSNGLRSAVDSATKAFASKLSSILQEDGAMVETPLLSSEDGSYDFANFEDVVEYGDHLEHFHSYQRDHPSKENEKSIDFHTDQGLFIAFTPAMIAKSVENKVAVAPGGGGFYVDLQDSTRVSVDFQPDDLIIMLGDGMNQILNSQKGGSNPKRKLRSTPHALIMPNYREGEVRVWHGRMVLPPSGAVHPEHGKTFGHMRKLMIEASTNNKIDAHLRSPVEEESLSIGCSSSLESARLLADEDVVCEEGTIYCWHRCMPHADHNVTTELCASRDLKLQCINPRNQVYIEGHGDFYPACSNSTENATEYPKLPTYPRDDSICDETNWNTFASTDGYEFVFDRLGDNQGQRGYWEGHENKGMGRVAKFMWNVVDDSQLVPRASHGHQDVKNDTLPSSKKIEGKVVFNGLFGYIAFGFAKEGGKKNGMNGGSIIMAIPGGNYTAMHGLDMSMESSVHEYVIDPVGSSFRHWTDPIPGRDNSAYKFESTPCFTSLTFTTGDINSIPFNFDGSDKVMWAANNADTFCGSHGRGQDGRGDRDAFMVEWKTGKAWFPVEIEEVESVEESTSSAMRKGVLEVVGLIFSVVAIFSVLL